MKNFFHTTSLRLAGLVCLIGGLGVLATPDARAATSENESEEASDSADTEESEESSVSIPGGTDARTFEFTYETTIEPGEVSGEVDVFIPLAPDTPHQTVLERTIDSPVEGDIRKGESQGNMYWYTSLDELPEDEPMTVTITHRIEREVFRRSKLNEKDAPQYEEGEREQYKEFLKADKRVPVSDDLVEQVAQDAELDKRETPLAKARQIYDFVIDKMEYKKVGEGWGEGNTYWACNEEYGNCTDYHALFTSLSRHEDIPSRFEIGFPIPTDREKGEIGGYHCWLQFYLPDVGWTPIDASEADKNPELKDMYFGTQPANRIRFTAGRDLQLGEDHDSRPLNYFIYPRVEVNDAVYEAVETNFSYEEVSASESS